MSAADYTTLTGQFEAHVIHVENVSPTAFILRFERRGMVFRPGQCVLLGLPGKKEHREYSIYSSVDDDFLEVLIKEVDGGQVSNQLRQRKSGQPVIVEGPIGFFTLSPDDLLTRKHVLIASGTGVAPFHSLVTSHPDMDYHLLHGVRYRTEAYGRTRYDRTRHVLCTSRDKSGDFQGRVTAYLEQNPVDPEARCFLCGNVKMIDDAHDILTRQGVPSEHIRTEVYF